MNNQEIHVPGKLRKYFTMLPNLYDDSGLDPYEFRLLAHYVRVGDCWEALATTARKCVMSRISVIRKRNALSDKGFIKLTRKRRTDTVSIEVIDMWDKNFGKYASVSENLASNSKILASISGIPDLVSQGYTKKNHIKNTPLRENYRAPHPALSGNGSSRKREPHIQGVLYDRMKRKE